MPKAGTKATVFIVMMISAGIVYLGFWVRNHGFSARERPSRFEEFLARHARKIATPSGARELKNPYTATSESTAEAREHWVAHCSSCHGLDGRGDTPIGRNLYPKAPDMNDAETQKLSDGELFYIISNGVRFTGMPAWGSEDSPESIWQLVSFIRRLPQLTPEEKKVMEELASGKIAERKPGAPKPHARTHAPGTEPHKH